MPFDSTGVNGFFSQDTISFGHYTLENQVFGEATYSKISSAVSLGALSFDVKLYFFLCSYRSKTANFELIYFSFKINIKGVLGFGLNYISSIFDQLNFSDEQKKFSIWLNRYK